MKDFTTIGLIFGLLLLTPALASAQPTPISTCECDYCYDNPIVSCTDATYGSGSCGLWYYLFCYPWHVPGNSLTGESQGEPMGHTWRTPTIADYLLASPPSAE